MDINEVIFVSSNNVQFWNTTVWDPRTGTNVMSYKGGNSAAPHTLNIVDDDYVVSADLVKPVLNVWPINSQSQLAHQRFVSPGRIAALAFSPDGNYCVGAVDSRIYVWQSSSGRMFTSVEKHYQDITCIKFLDDGSHFITAGMDGLVLVWSLSKLVALYGNDIFSRSSIEQSDPVFTISDHSLPVTDIYVGYGGIQSRFVTVSLDKTCRLYCFSSKKPLLVTNFPAKLTAVTMNTTESVIYVGDNDGNIWDLNITSPPRTINYSVDEKQVKKFNRHTKKITTISLSIDDVLMLSGSDDETVIIWDIPSRQPIRVIPQQGHVTNAFFKMVTTNMFSQDFKPKIILQPLQRTTSISNDKEGILEIVHTNEIDEEPPQIEMSINITSPTETVNKFKDLEAEVESLRKINAQLYQIALGNIVKNHSRSKDRPETISLVKPPNKKRKKNSKN